LAATWQACLAGFYESGLHISSGIALLIQMLIGASNSGQKVSAFGLPPHFTKFFTMVGITKYSRMFPNEADALAAM
jgi:anti-sigma B factor antagonist